MEVTSSPEMSVVFHWATPPDTPEYWTKDSEKSSS
jgi:hypothetical protein